MQTHLKLSLSVCACALLLFCNAGFAAPTVTLDIPSSGIMMGTSMDVTATFTGDVTSQSYTLAASDGDVVVPATCSVSVAAPTCSFRLSTHWDTSLANSSSYTHQLTFTGGGDSITPPYTIVTPTVYLSQVGDATDSGAGVPFNPSGRFTTISGCIHDNLTNLTWVADLSSVPIVNAHAGTATNFANAVASIKSINENGGLCGYTDWRLPTVSELYSLVDYSQVSPQSWLNQNGFSHVGIVYWSSSVFAPNPDTTAWYVAMTNGFVYPDAVSYSYYVWPVRVGQ